MDTSINCISSTISRACRERQRRIARAANAGNLRSRIAPLV